MAYLSFLVTLSDRSFEDYGTAPQQSGTREEAQFMPTAAATVIQFKTITTA